jgi:arabinan endo-1,5-alpha-L-arabinosidase
MCKDEHWLFYTGIGVPSRRSRDLVEWTSGPPALPAKPEWIDAFLPGHPGHFWAPDAILLDGRYLLYYSVSRWGKNTSAIGLASNPTLDPDDPRFCWKDEGIVIRSSPPDDYNAIDPSVAADGAGRLWMAFGSFWGGIRLIELDPGTGRRISPDSPLYPLAWQREIEAAAIRRHGDEYFLFVNWGRCCSGTNSTYNIRVGRSADITGPYRDRDGVDLLVGGGLLFLESTGRFIGPGHFAAFAVGSAEEFSYHYYDAENRGAPTLGIRQLRWTTQGWPIAAP